jgi:multidrug efflux pump subunit AcrA (membrane-fusion protein)
MQRRLRALMRAAAALITISVSPALLHAAETSAAVSVIQAKKRCFPATVAVSGHLAPREEVSVRPDREGFQIAEVLVDAGDTVTAGQALARLTPAPGAQGASGTVTVQAQVAGLILKSDAVVGTMASMRAPPLFQIAARGELELLAELPASQLSKVSINQKATVGTAGIEQFAGQVRLVAPSVDGATQLGQIRIGVGADRRLRVGQFGRALIVTGESCSVAVPLSALLFDRDIAIVAVVRNNRVETRRVVLGALSDGQIEAREGLAEGDLVVAKAGAFFREGDRVRSFLDGKPISAD